MYFWLPTGKVSNSAEKAESNEVDYKNI